MPRQKVAYFSGEVMECSWRFRFETSREVESRSHRRPPPAPARTSHPATFATATRRELCSVAISSAAEIPLPATSPMARATSASPTHSKS